MTLVKQINIVNKRIKTTDHIHVFATKFHFIMNGKHILFLSRSLSLTDAVCTRVVSASPPRVFIILLIIQRPIIDYYMPN